MKFPEEVQQRLIERLSGWFSNSPDLGANAPGVLSSESGQIRLHISRASGKVRIFIRDNSLYTRLENWGTSDYLADSDMKEPQLWIDGLSRIQDFRIAAQVAIILDCLGIIEPTLSAPVGPAMPRENA